MDRKLGGLTLLIAVLCSPALIARPYQCVELDSAASELEFATNNLARCIKSRDYEDDCSSQARKVKNAADDYESAVSNAQGDFGGEVSTVCPSPETRIWQIYQ